ncbi:DUF5381 family protein [Metabacillus sp. FJAT-52054]|uniref:DUF5381 family protein n=1 Tax=Metabacillus sediminis TaxID=3117746 RepID=A0ABZ2NFF6_9BACI
MLNNQSPAIIEVKAFSRFVVWFFISSAGVFIFCLWVFLDALQFESKYSLSGIVGGFAGMIWGLYIFLHSSPGVFKNRRVIFEIVPGPEGRVQSRKKSVAIKDIRDLEIRRRGISLRSIFYEDLVIYTHQGKVVQMKTYNLVNDLTFNQQIQQYVLPFMTPDAQEAYKRKYKQFPSNTGHLERR